MTTTCELESNQNKQKLVSIVPKTYKYELYENVHLALPPPGDREKGETHYTRGHFKYFHYGCDGHSDAGWGCGYRTLQTALSWIMNERRRATGSQAERMSQHVPSIGEIQRMLVQIGDKSQKFIGSRDWIGTLEEFYVMDFLFEELPCKILHAQQLNSEEVVGQIRSYFAEYAGFIAMGGLSDMASKAIAGIHVGRGQASGKQDVSVLIVVSQLIKVQSRAYAYSNFFFLSQDPHYSGVPSSKQELIDKHYVRWMHISEFQNSAYNLCFILQK